MSQSYNYAQLLRPVGQMLEGLGVESFSLTLEGNDVVVRGEKPVPPPDPVEGTTLRVVWQRLRGKKVEPAEVPEPSSGLIELRYAMEEIAKMDREGQAKRTAASEPAEAHSPSQVLRAAGAFVDQKAGRFLAVTKKEDTITIEYESTLGQKHAEELSVSALYDVWVKMYLRRKNR